VIHGFDPLPFAIPVFILLIVAEMIWAWRKRPTAYEPRDTLISLALGLGSTMAGMAAAGGILLAADWLAQYRVATLGWAWWVWIACFVLDDFNYYWAHRTGHRVRWFWAAHVNHHSSQHYNLSTALRQSWSSFFALSFVFRIWPVLLGFDPAMIFTVGAINLIYQFWIHTEVIHRLPLGLEAVLNTPSHHRVHHATNPVYLDRNYAGVFIIWDRMFGTFQREQDDGRIRYGLVRQLGSFNLIWAAFHEWSAMLKDFAAAPWRHKLAYLWRVPGWSHDDSRDTSDAIRARWHDNNPS
jgi:sterol desaturase/sphingolipid hydroxylase (fatty acid hydroxylase superfamily)